MKVPPERVGRVEKGKENRMKNILFLASEAVPFIKTGGLADVVGSLPRAIDKNYFDVRIMIPKYLCMREELRNDLEYVTHFYMDYLGQSRYVGVLKKEVDGILYYFIDNEYYFAGDRPYGNWYWDLEKFCFFSYAALSALPLLDFHPDVLHCHDWQTGLVPVLLKDRFAGGEFFRSIRSVFTIHNLRFQGMWDRKTIQRFTELSDYYFTPDKLEFHKDGNLLKGGLVYADAITTVSKAYAKEIQNAFYGEGLEGLLQARDQDLRGIVNGIDYELWNPKRDRFLDFPYDKVSVYKEKVKNKMALQERLGLDVAENTMLISIVSRLTDQKGLDLVERVFDELCQDSLQFVILGTGEERYENFFRYFAWKYPNRVSAQIYYSEEASHRIYAGSDALLLPSLFEPCGLSQLIALRYGTVPIVRETGGLRDTVEPYNEYEKKGDGFSFANYNAHEMMASIRYAEKVYYDDKKGWRGIIKRGMKKNFSWESSALQYQELYDWLVERK